MATITIGGTDYDVYQTVAEITVYAQAAVGDNADAWLAAAAALQARCGVSSTRLLDRLQWAGEKTDPAQLHAFPRTGLTYADGTVVPSDSVPQQLLDANSEAAMGYAAGAAVETDSNGQVTRRLKAGSVEIEYFRNVDGSSTPLPQTMMDLIGQWLGGGSSFDLATSSGTCKPTEFDRQYDLTRGF